MTEPIWARSATDLASELADGRIRSVDIVAALQERANDVEPLVCGFARRQTETALREAEYADTERKAGRIRGPLHGLPLSFKENIDIAGLPTTLGLQARSMEAAAQDAVLVQVAREAAMVILGKSNVPQALISGMECGNPLFGTTRNPFSLAHGPGGSSGGEGALLASGSSVLGVGTDMAGSIRFPATFCGVVGLKPTARRWSNTGLRTFIAGQEIVGPQTGPMARTVADVALLFNGLSIDTQSRLDADVPPVPTASAPVRLEGLRIGYFDDDGFFAPAASIRRAVNEAVKALADRGAILVPFPPAQQEEMLELFVAVVSSDGMKTALGQLKGETIADTMRELWLSAQVPETLRDGFAKLLPRFGEARLGRLLQASRGLEVHEYWKLAERRRAFKVAEIDRWNRAQIDVVLCPPSVTPAVPIGKSRGLAAATLGYTARYNIVGFPAGVVPTTRVRPSETTRTQCIDRLDRLAGDVESRSAGFPIGVQVAGRPFREDQVLAVMGALEEWAKQHSDPLQTPVRSISQK